VSRLDALRSESVGIVIVQCVLEEVPDISAALAELARVLASDGAAFLEIPFNPSIERSVSQAPDHFGDVWRFGADLPDMVRRSFGSVVVVGQEEGDYFGRVCICRHTG
jgi:ubiquinone/menaquinone biosynthesis C-methylase UbiE